MKLLSTELRGHASVFHNLWFNLREYASSRKRYGMGYYRFLHKLSIMETGSQNAQQAYRDAEFREIVRHAVEHSPFYQELYGQEVYRINGISDSSILPPVEERLFNERIDAIYTIPGNQQAGRKSADCENTAPLRLTKLDVQKQQAVIDHFMRECGAVNLEMKRATFCGGDFLPSGQTEGAVWRDIYYLNQRIYSAQHCTEPFLSKIVENLNRFKPDFIDGPAPAILAISRFLNERRIVLEFQAIAIFMEADNFIKGERVEVENAFGCKARRWSRKTGKSPFLFECANGNLHFNSFAGLLEFGASGEVLLTRFDTAGTPIIRLKIPERLRPVHCPCPCGSRHPLVRTQEGMESAFLQSKTRGKVTSLYLATVRDKFQEAAPFMQFVQDSADGVVIRVGGGEGITPALEKEIIQEMRAAFGEDMHFTVKRQTGKPHEKDSERELVINNLQEMEVCGSDEGTG